MAQACKSESFIYPFVCQANQRGDIAPLKIDLNEGKDRPDVKSKEAEMVKTEPDVKPKGKEIVKTKPNIEFKKEDKQDVKMMKSEPSMDKITYEKEKVALVLGITSIFTV